MFAPPFSIPTARDDRIEKPPLLGEVSRLVVTEGFLFLTKA